MPFMRPLQEALELPDLHLKAPDVVYDINSCTLVNISNDYSRYNSCIGHACCCYNL